MRDLKTVTYSDSSDFFSTNDTCNVISKAHRLRKILIEAIAYFGVFVFIFVSYIIFKPLNEAGGTGNGIIAKIYGAVMLLGILIAWYVMRLRGKLTLQNKIILIALTALAMHLTYMLYTPYTVRQHDTWSVNADGHYDYARIFYETWALPTTKVSVNDVYQFYHPPLNAITQAIFMHLFNAVCSGSSLASTVEDLFGATQILMCFYMFITSVFIIKTLRLTKLSERSLIISSIFGALFPRLNELSGQLNNDSLSIMLSVIAIYYAFRWYLKGKRLKDIIAMAFAIGLAMMTKLSAAAVCIGIGVMFIVEFVKSCKKRDETLKPWIIIAQYAIFLVICAPIGLWFQVYSHVVYGLPYGFVFKSLNSALFTGTETYVNANFDAAGIAYYASNNSGLIYTNYFLNICARFVFPFYIPDILQGGPLFASASNNYNLLSYAIKTATFGEFSYWGGGSFGLIALLMGYIICFGIIVALIYLHIKKVSIGKAGNFSLWLILGLIMAYIYFNIRMPYGCTMDFRYIVPIILPLALMLGKLCDKLQVCRENFAKNLVYILVFSSIGYILASSIFYLAAI